MQADPADQDFLERMQALLGMDEDRVKSVVEALSADDLVDLTDAVAQDDKSLAEDIIGSLGDDATESVNPLFRGKNLDVGSQERKTKWRKTDVFTIGEEVEIDVTTKSGKQKSITATVIQPDAPGNTVLVKHEGKRRMVDKHNVHAIEDLKEAILGLTGLPDLQRMQQLAGIELSAAKAPEIEVPAAPGCDSPMMQVTAALDALETALPAVVMADLKTIRQRLATIQGKLNETAQYRRRPA